MRSYQALLLRLCCPLLLLPFGAAAFAGQGPTFEGTSQVVSVEVPVNVVNREGEPLRGLTLSRWSTSRL
jgi:hypothetical protein